jgi:phenylalanine ammonia-lyase
MEGTPIRLALITPARLGLDTFRAALKEVLSAGDVAVVVLDLAGADEDDWRLTALTLGIHALFAQALLATSQFFEPFIHAHKAHAGQVWTARQMAALLAGSALIRDEAAGDRSERLGKLIQDRYSLRCLPQYLGPVIDALRIITAQIEQEANSANDNPLVDADSGAIYHTGNFLAQYTGVAMDQLRFQLAMMAKHLDAQIALLVTPEFSAGLPPSLVGNLEAGFNVGLKSLQIVNNALMPLIAFYGQPIVDRYPTHADQYNQNISSQSMSAANLARESLERFEHYLANALVFAVQAAELRAQAESGSYDARAVLSPATQEIYAAARGAAGMNGSDRPLLWDDLDRSIQSRVEGVLADLRGGGFILRTVAGLVRALRERS